MQCIQTNKVATGPTLEPRLNTRQQDHDERRQDSHIPRYTPLFHRPEQACGARAGGPLLDRSRDHVALAAAGFLDTSF